MQILSTASPSQHENLPALRQPVKRAHAVSAVTLIPNTLSEHKLPQTHALEGELIGRPGLKTGPLIRPSSAVLHAQTVDEPTGKVERVQTAHRAISAYLTQQDMHHNLLPHKGVLIDRFA